MGQLDVFKFDRTYQQWTGERILRHLLYWLAWIIFYAVVNSGYHDQGFSTWALVELVIIPIKLLYVYTVIYGLLPRYLINRRYSVFFPVAILLALMGGLTISIIDRTIISPHILGQPLYGYFLHKKMVYKCLDLVYIASLPTIIKLWQRQVGQEKAQQALATQKLGAELQLLKNQLQPHFLFNTLNNLYGMVLSQHERAAEVVLRLSNMMSYMLYECNEEQITLTKEVEQLQNYIELERIRFGDRLEVSFEVGGDIEHETIAPLLLIGFWENAFKHGPAKQDRNAWISGHLWVQNAQLRFTLENSTLGTIEMNSPQEQQAGGIGLQNVQKRLALLYPDQHRLDIHSNDTFLVNLDIDLTTLTT